MRYRIINALLYAYRKRIPVDWKLFVGWFLVYGLITPILSWSYDSSLWIDQVKNDGMNHESFEALHTFMAIGRQWFIGISELLIFSIIFWNQLLEKEKNFE